MLLARVGASGPEATGYNSFPLNDCPQQLWSKLDAEAIARDNDAAAALLNGPRHWLTSSIGKVAQGPPETKTFGGVEMLRQATVQLSAMNPAPYTVNRVARNTVFTFDAGQPVFELADPDGQRRVMQTWSRTVDSSLSLDDLPGLAGRLSLPAVDLRGTHAHHAAAGRHHDGTRARDPGRPGQQLLAGDRLTRGPAYRYWPRLDSVSIARDALDDLPVTSVRM